MVFTVGFIGFGAMAKLYYKYFKNVRFIATDLPKNLMEIKSSFSNLEVFDSAIAVAREADYLLFSVDTKSLEKLVENVGPSIKMNAIVGGTTSVKQVEIEYFEKYVPSDVDIITFHSMHGPSVDPKGMPLVFIPYRCSAKSRKLILLLLESLSSKIVELNTGIEHDNITADTQAVTHVAFMSMGLAWKSRKVYPWETNLYVGGIENVKIAFMCRIFSSASHVYSGLAILNSKAHEQCAQYSESVKSLFRLMIEENEVELRSRVYQAREFVFKNREKNHILLSEELLQSDSGIQKDLKPNSHLSLLSIVDSWYNLKVSPYDHLICQTPPFVLWLGIVEYIFCNESLLESCIRTALYDKTIRSDDLEFCSSAQSWVQLIQTKSFEAYDQQFLEIKQFFGEKLKIGFEMSSAIIKKLNN
eukprot:NODE_14_length_51535_cov_1.125049.p10 type:complete len:416 gc:universal NODE_14_length_51535_cov_1.125049:48093-46846(-)